MIFKRLTLNYLPLLDASYWPEIILSCSVLNCFNLKSSNLTHNIFPTTAWTHPTNYLIEIIFTTNLVLYSTFPTFFYHNRFHQHIILAPLCLLHLLGCFVNRQVHGYPWGEIMGGIRVVSVYQLKKCYCALNLCVDFWKERR